MEMPNIRGLRGYTKRVWLTVGIVSAVLMALAATIWLIQGILLIFAGILFGVFLNHLSRLVAAAGSIRYGAALAIVVVALITLLGAIGYLMGSRINQQAAEFSSQFSSAAQNVWHRLEQSGLQKWSEENTADGPAGLLPSNSKMMATAKSAITSIVSVVGGLVLVIFMGFYVALAPDTYKEGVVRLCPLNARPRIGNVLHTISNTLWWWILGRLAAMAIIGIGSGMGLWVIGIPLPITQGVLAGILNFVPNLGPLVASVPPILFGLQQGGSTAFYVAGFYLALQFVESYLVTPLINQRQVRLPPALTLSAQLLMGMTAGFLGLLLATPLCAVASVIARELYVEDMLETDASNQQQLGM
jgi:predicted PurR-regulated permease PerM